MFYSIELGLRGLLRHPRTMGLSILTLALGLAAVMTMLTLLAMLQADPLPGLSQNLYLGWVDARDLPKPDDKPEDNSSIPLLPVLKQIDVDALAEAHPKMRIGAVSHLMLQLSSPDGLHDELSETMVTYGPILSMFGVPLLHGRYWTAQEEQAQAHVIIINKSLSLKLFGDENGVGRDVRSGTTLYRVIGISGKWNPQPQFHSVVGGFNAWGGKDSKGEQVFLPATVVGNADVTMYLNSLCEHTDVNDGPVFGGHQDLAHCRWLVPWAELRTPQQVSEFRDGLSAFVNDRHKSGAFPRPPSSRLYSVREWLQANNVVPDSVHLNLWLASGLLLLCMVNVAGLLAARFLRRAGELGVRRILGAPRRSIVVQCLVEAGAAGLLGGLLALPLTLFGLWVVRMQNQGYTDQAHLNPWLFIALLVLSALTGLLVGTLPAWRAAQLEPAMQVKSL